MESCPCGPMLCGECQFEPSAGWKAVSNRNASNQDITQDHISKIPWVKSRVREEIEGYDED